MDGSQILLKVRGPVLGIKAVNFVDFVRPIETQILDQRIPKSLDAQLPI